MTAAAGILFLTDDNQVLLLKRGPGGDYPGSWCFPGGQAEDGETVEQAAEREAVEELGFLPPGKRAELTRQIREGVDYTTFLQRVPDVFVPKLNGEHTGFMWVHVSAIDSLGPSKDDLKRDDAGDFDESKHPRAEDGKFGSGGGTSRAGLKETRSEGKFRVQHPGGEALPEHIQKLKLPPAWTDVRYSADPDSDLMATGKDAKGRVQSVYSKKFMDTQAAAKFARIHTLMKKFKEITRQNDEARKSADPRTRDSADCLHLVMKMGIRPGSETDTGAKVRAYGATTLEGRHVVVDGKKVSLQFVGKKGVSLNLLVEDEELASMLVDRAVAGGHTGKLFPETDEKRLLDHTHTMDGGSFKTKDFRTNLGTSTAYELVRKGPAPTSEADYRRRVMEVARVVSGKLGDTPVIALQSYISPTVFAEWRTSAGA